MRTPRRPRTRTLQRGLHLSTGVVVMYAVYVPPEPGSALGLAVRLVLVPGLVISGVAMWKWAKVRRRFGSRPGATRTTRRAA